MIDQPVLCLGETLWDVLPTGEFLGGAPFNVAAHLVRLGVPALPVTRIGDDVRGAAAVSRMRSIGIQASLVQTDPILPTGVARAVIGANGAAEYEFTHPAAWDRIESTESALAAARIAPAVVFGTLAQRSRESRASIHHLVDAAQWRILDLNLRAPHADRDVVLASLAKSHLVKLNDDEMRTLSSWLGIESEPGRLRAVLADRFGIGSVCITYGADGAQLWHDGEWHRQSAVPTKIADTVGAGDSFLATLVAGLIARRPPGVVMRHAARVASYVASQHGAIPDYDPARFLE
jgi:fructokinase